MSSLALDYLEPVEAHLIASTKVDQTFQIMVMTPAQAPGEDTFFPVIYATDANQFFAALCAMALGLQRNRQDVTRFILVGIGYPGDNPFAGSLLRGRDFTFDGYPAVGGRRPRLAGIAPLPEGAPCFGGADAFKAFLREELIPFIERHYRAAPDKRCYYGHSAGGGFGLYTLFTEPALFNSYIIASPGVTYHGETWSGVRYDNHEFLLDRAGAFLKQRGTLPRVSLHLSVGGQEEFEKEVEPWRVTSSAYRLASMLAAAELPGLDLHFEVLHGETHMSTWPIAFMHGVRALFPAIRPPPPVSEA